MRVVVQRVASASVAIDGHRVACIGRGLLVLVGIEDRDGQGDADYLTKKLAALRIFEDKDGVMNLSLVDIGAEMLIVSQFTLMASTHKGNRPSYIRASKPEKAIPLYEYFCQRAEQAIGRPVPTGIFGADMQSSYSTMAP